MGLILQGLERGVGSDLLILKGFFWEGRKEGFEKVFGVGILVRWRI